MQNNVGIKDLTINDIDFWGENKLCNGGIRIYWSADIGFGTLDIVKDNKNNILGHTERMCDNDDKKFIELIFNEIIKNINVID